MLHFERWKIYSILGACILGLLFSVPNFVAKETVATWPSWAPKSQLPLGLDLRGGAHLLLAMDTDELRRDWLGNLREDARKSMRDAKIGVTGLGVSGGGVQVRLNKPEDFDKAFVELKKLIQPVGNLVLGTSGNDLEVEKGIEPGVVVLKPSQQGIDQRVESAISTSIETINRRINALGTAESTVVRQGRDRILIQYPGLQDTTQLKKLIGETAKLTFHEVHRTVTAAEAKEGRVPIGYKLYESGEAEAERRGSGYLLKEVPVVSGEALVDAQPGFDQRTNEPVINFRFDQKGALFFGKFTRDHVNEPFAIVLDSKVISAPVVREPILGGSGQISGSFTVETANSLAIQLRSGALPAKLTIVEERTVGPSLGADSIEAGKKAAIVGTIAVAAFMIFAYGLFGLFAVLAVIINLLMIVSAMSLIGSTLTLPGIAGLVLTVGMAVDANVLIYERIREELRNGRQPIGAIDAGFSRALATILDSNLTTLIAGLVMFWLGSGPIRGFAVTLSLGILGTVFTAFTLTRLLVSLWLKSQKTRKIQAPL